MQDFYNMELSLKDIFLLFTVFQLFVFALILVLHIPRRTAGHFYLAMFFFSLSLNIFNLFMVQHEPIFGGFSIHLFFLGSPFAYAYAPSFYLYNLSITHTPFKLRLQHLLHYLPFMVYMLYIIFTFTRFPYARKIAFLEASTPYSHSEYILLSAGLHVQVLLYAVLIFKNIRSYSSQIKEVHSSLSKANYAWLNSLLIGIAIIWILDLARFLLLFVSLSFRSKVEAGLFISFTLFCYFFIFKAFTQPIFSVAGLDGETKKLSLSDQVRKKHFQSLQHYMEHQKTYLDPELTLMDLAERLSIPSRSLSEVINRSFGQNFYDFVNTYRIQEAELIFQQDLHQKKTILEVLYEVGFNSKSSFNTAFKKKTGLTPSEYRKACISPLNIL